MSAARIDVWSDYVCPFCYLAEPTLQRIEQEFADAVEVVWRAFELRPEPVPTLDPKGDYLRDIWASALIDLKPMLRYQLVQHLPRNLGERRLPDGARTRHDPAAAAGAAAQPPGA